MHLKQRVLRHAGLLAAAFIPGWLLAMLGAMSGWWRASPGWLAWFLATLAGVILLAVWVRWQREQYIREAPLPQFLKRKLRESYPHLSGKDVDLVERGMRQFFLACARSRRQFVAMPSQVVDAMWHEFILHTRAYRDWCQLALGWFLHHTPALALGGVARDNDGLRRAWYWACRDEAIDPHAPSRLPLLFALDAKLGIANGFHYVPDCRGVARRSDAGGVHCGTSFSDASYSGDAGSFGGMASSADGSGAGGGGPDAGGDGGGCGGGGD